MILNICKTAFLCCIFALEFDLEASMLLKLNREKQVGDGIFGHLDVDGVRFCTTIERASTAILPLHYSVSVTHSPKFGRLLPILNNVPGRNGIRIHGGTRPAHSKGCILLPPGKTDELVQMLLKDKKTGNYITVEPL